MAIIPRSVMRLAPDRLGFFCQMTLIPNVVNKLIFSHLLFGSYALTIVAWILVYTLCRLFYALVLYPTYFTPFRHLPTPKKRSLLWGNAPPMFSESPGFTTRRHMETTPNDGLIRYYGFLNQERILITSKKGFGEVLVQHGYDFSKTFALKYSIARITGEGLGYAEGDDHRTQKKGLLSAFSYRHIKTLYPIFWNKAIEMAQCMESEIARMSIGTTPSYEGSQGKKERTGTLVIRDWASRVTLDIIGVAGMDQDFSALKHPDNELNSIYRTLFSPPTRAMQIFARVGFVFNPRWLAMLPIQRNRDIKECSAKLRDVARGIIRQKRAKDKDNGQTDLIGVALESNVFGEENLVAQMMTFLAAGHETTATALQWFVYALCLHPDVQTRLREEVRANLPPTSDTETPEIPDAAAVDALPYLNAVCAEVLRFYPPVPMTVREALCDTVILGTPIPKGTVMVISAPATNQSTEFWGPDAKIFDPERWIGPGRANTGGANTNYANMTFIHGPRSCIGATFTKSELMCIIAVLVGKFKFELEDPNAELELAMSFMLAPEDGVRAKVEVLDGW